VSVSARVCGELYLHVVRSCYIFELEVLNSPKSNVNLAFLVTSAAAGVDVA
jgi:hypothetical protein